MKPERHLSCSNTPKSRLQQISKWAWPVSVYQP